ncbi:MAG: efflux RND transporter periplasmic adaptor subunit [Burkholderiaceae bacterium]
MKRLIAIGLVVVAVAGFAAYRWLQGADGAGSVASAGSDAVAGRLDDTPHGRDAVLAQNAAARSPAAGRRDELPAISVVQASTATIVSRLNVSGMIEAAERVVVQPEIEGLAIAEIMVEVGDTVQAGQVLARLADDSLQLQRGQLTASASSAQANIAQFRAQIVEAQAAANEAERARARSAKLAKQGVLSQASLDQADAAATAAQARLSAARQGLNAARAQAEVVAAQIANLDYRLARTKVKAPVAGLISARSARLGAIASAAGEPMFALIRDGALELRADVAEGDLLSIEKGLAAAVFATGLGAPLSGHVRLIEPTIDAQTRLGRVRIALDDSQRVRAGMFADARITLGEHSGVSLPVAAVQRESGSARVLRIEGDKVVSADVVTGIADERRVAILSGLAAGDWVVARAGAFVRPGDRIRPIKPSGTEPGRAE